MFPAYEHVPAYPVVFPLFYGAVVFFALAMARHVRIFALAASSQPFDDGRLRVVGLFRYALGQVRMFSELRAGLMHMAIFSGFVALTIGTADIALGGLLQAVVRWPWDGRLWAAILALQNAMGLVVLAAVGYAAWRRLVSRPARLTLSASALAILGLIAGIVLAELLSGAFEAARYGDRPGAFIANAVADPLRQISPDLLVVGFAVSWWTHIVLVTAFLVYLPFSKHLHIATSFVNVYLRKLIPRGQLPATDLSREDQTFGVRTLGDLGWKDLLDAFTCTECGRCQEQCPAWATGKPLNPKSFVLGIRRMAVTAEASRPLIVAPWFTHRTDDSHRVAANRLSGPIVGDAISYDAVWDCLTCGACVEACPVLIEHVDKIVGLRRNMVLEESTFPRELSVAFRAMEKTRNPWGMTQPSRLEWTAGLPFAVPTAAQLAADGRLGELEVLYWVGCAASFDDRNRKVARALATCLHAAGVEFAVLGEEESCSGDPARRMGNEYVFQMLAEANIQTLRRYGMERRTIVTACPHCFNTIANEYCQFGAQFHVVHHSVFLASLVRNGRLRLSSSPALAANAVRSATLHDSCYLSRYNGVTDEPRQVLASVSGLQLREMEKRRSKAFCCGAGGGRMWMEETRGTKINVERARQIRETGAEAVATECPFCLTMLMDGLASIRDAGTPVQTLDLAEILAGALATDPASAPTDNGQ